MDGISSPVNSNEPPYWDIKDIPSFQENQINYRR